MEQHKKIWWALYVGVVAWSLLRYRLKHQKKMLKRCKTGTATKELDEQKSALVSEWESFGGNKKRQKGPRNERRKKWLTNLLEMKTVKQRFTTRCGAAAKMNGIFAASWCDVCNDDVLLLLWLFLFRLLSHFMFFCCWLLFSFSGAFCLLLCVLFAFSFLSNTV